MKLGEQISHDNKLLSCLQVVARFYDRPDSETVLISGLDFESAQLSVPILLRAAERIGLFSEYKQLPLSGLASFHLPVMLLLMDGSALVLLEMLDAKHVLVQYSPTSSPATISFKQLEASYTGSAITFEPQFSAPDSMEKSTSVTIKQPHWFWGTVSGFWRYYTHVIFAAVAINMIALASPLFVLNVYDRVLPNKAFSTLWVLAIGLMLAVLFDFLIKTARAHLIDKVGRQIDIKLSSLIFEKVLNTDMKARPSSTGGFTNRVQQYEFIREFFTSNSIALFTDFLFIFVFLFVIYELSGWIVVFPLAAVVMTIMIGTLLQYLIGKKLNAAQNEAAIRQGLLVEAIAGVETLKCLRAEGYFLKKWDTYAKFASRTSESIKSLSATGLNLTQFLSQLVTLGIIVGGTYRFSEGEISMGAIIATVMLASRAIAPLSQIAMTLSRARQAKLSLSILNEVMSLPDDRLITQNFVNREVQQGKIQFRAVTFKYPEVDRKVLTDVTFTVQAGERVGIIGQSGSGKTTIGRLITRLYHPSEGEILIDDIDIGQYHSHEIRKSVGFLLQEAELFSGSVKENLLIASPTASDETLIEVASISGVDRFVSQHHLGFDMPVGERGNLLSGGQRQAIAFARVMLSNPKIMILDEPSSSMDKSAVAKLITNIKKHITSEQTLIISTHQDQLLVLVDRLIVLGNGVIVADGEKEKVLNYLRNKA